MNLSELFGGKAKKLIKKKRIFILAFLVLFFVVGLSVFVWRRAVSAAESEPVAKPVYLDAEQCCALLEGHEDSFLTVVSCIKERGRGYLEVDENGLTSGSKYLLQNTAFMDAIEEIYSDPLFCGRPKISLSGGEEDGLLGVDFLLYYNEANYTYSGIVYHEYPVESYHPAYESRMRENWYWYDYPMI